MRYVWAVNNAGADSSDQERRCDNEDLELERYHESPEATKESHRREWIVVAHNEARQRGGWDGRVVE